MTGLQSNYPIVFDSTTMPSPSEWNEKSAVVENVNITEAGTDQVEVVRNDKLSISVKYKIAESNAGGDWAKTLKAFSKQTSIQVKRYDILAQAYETRSMRMRDFTANLVHKSDYLTAVNGVWEISFTLLEF